MKALDKTSYIIVFLFLAIAISLLCSLVLIKNQLGIKSKKALINDGANSTLELIVEKCNLGTDNASRTECLIERLDRVAAEREWKQRKLETIKPLQIDENNIVIGLLSDKQLKITKWREGLEKLRDNWCEARYMLADGSGVLGDMTTCQLEFELLAIKDLDAIYYDVVMDKHAFSKGVPDFEPKKEDIDKLIKTSITSRGCALTGDANCY
jgi:hypothetical protein